MSYTIFTRVDESMVKFTFDCTRGGRSVCLNCIIFIGHVVICTNMHVEKLIKTYI